MTNSLKILLLEDNPNDVKLVEFELKKSNLTFTLKNTDDKEGFIDELENFKPDIILSDFNLPNFHGLDALEVSKIQAPETPFILVTGNLDEETAVNCIKLGAWDYILKDKLVRLVPSINSSLKLKEEIKEKNKAIEDLKKSEAKYQDLYDNAPDMFLSIDPITGIIINCNKTLLTKLGYSSEEFIGHEIYEFYTKEISLYAKEVLVPLYAKRGKLRGTELQVVKKDGSIIDVSLTNSAIYNEKGQIIQSRSIWRDITEKKKTEATIKKSEERYRAMLDAMQDIIIIISRDNGITYMNPTANKKSKNKESSKYCFETLFGLDQVCNDCKASSLSGRETYHREIKDPEDNSVYLASFSPIKNIDGSESVMCIYRDITSLRKTENELREEKNLLSIRVDQRTADLSRLNAELEKALRMKDEFLANMSHELRTPLNSILGLSEVLQDELYGPLNQNQQKSLKTIEESGRHLLALINDILDVAKIEAGKIELELSPCSIHGICQASLNFIKQTALNKNINYSIKIETTSETIYADERRLKQILINLLSNAVKFTPQNGEIGLNVYENRSDENFTFTVWDKGIGIKPESIQKLFKPFVQIDSSLSREFAGTGLGLTLMKNLTEMHGGCVTVESTEGKGSEFSITIPNKICNNSIDQTNTGEFQIFAQNQNRNPVGKVFIVEDVSTEFEYLSIFKDQLGLEYQISRDNSNIIESIQRYNPDMIIIDKELNDIVMWDKFEKIKNNQIISRIPLIVLSKTETDKDLDGGLVNKCIVKPLTKEKLEEVVTKFIINAHEQAVEKNLKEKGLILIAEDNENNIQMMLDYFRNQNYKIICARNGKETIELAEEKYPDIILMDIQMPVMDGIEASETIRKHKDEKVANIPIIALTALAMPGDRQKCLDVGMNDYVKKPVRLKQLVLKIEEILSKNK
jgi:PAS domain S-box-containing protein